MNFRSLPAACRVGDEAVDQLKRPHLKPQVAPGQRCDARRPRLSNPHRTGLVTVLRSPSNDKRRNRKQEEKYHTHTQTLFDTHSWMKTRIQHDNNKICKKKKQTQTQKLATSCCAGLYILYMTFDTATPL